MILGSDYDNWLSQPYYREDPGFDYIDCSRCGNPYPIDLFEEINSDDCHHCLHYEDKIDDLEFERLDIKYDQINRSNENVFQPV